MRAVEHLLEAAAVVVLGGVFSDSASPHTKVVLAVVVVVVVPGADVVVPVAVFIIVLGVGHGHPPDRKARSEVRLYF
jgi:hypothetical protein